MLESDDSRQERELQSDHSEQRVEALLGTRQTITASECLGLSPVQRTEAQEDASEAVSCYGPWGSDLSAAIQLLEHPTMIHGPHGDFVRGQRDSLLKALRAALRETSERHIRYIKVAI